MRHGYRILTGRDGHPGLGVKDANPIATRHSDTGRIAPVPIVVLAETGDAPTRVPERAARGRRSQSSVMFRTDPGWGPACGRTSVWAYPPRRRPPDAGLLPADPHDPELTDAACLSDQSMASELALQRATHR